MLFRGLELNVIGSQHVDLQKSDFLRPEIEFVSAALLTNRSDESNNEYHDKSGAGEPQPYINSTSDSHGNSFREFDLQEFWDQRNQEVPTNGASLNPDELWANQCLISSDEPQSQESYATLTETRAPESTQSPIVTESNKNYKRQREEDDKWNNDDGRISLALCLQWKTCLRKQNWRSCK